LTNLIKKQHFADKFNLKKTLIPGRTPATVFFSFRWAAKINLPFSVEAVVAGNL
jgi:hypothetical protein